MLYEHYASLAGGDVLVQSNGTIIPYGVNTNIVGTSLNNYIFVQQTYNPSS